MGKSASSSKQIKRSKDSSKLRSVKKKKKTKRNKSKKIRRIKDYSDESESSGSDSSLYSSSSEDDHRREKRRSKVSKKKRSRKRYSSSESDDDDDDDIRHLKKKKRSKRKDEHVGTKKKKKKKRAVSRKRRKRDSSSSYTSSDSYSTRDSDDGSESDGKRRARNRGRLGKLKDLRRRSKDGLEEESEPDECWQVEDEVTTEKNSRRLKSIIVVSYAYDNDDRKEDFGGGHDGESDERDGEARISYHRTRGDENGLESARFDEFEDDIRSETSKASYPDNSLKDDDLEAILKKRALENLKRFRGETQKNGISRKEVSSVSEGEETLQTESGKVEESQDDGLMEQKLCVSAEGKDLESSQKILQVDQQAGDSAKVKSSFGVSSCTTKRKLIRPVLGQESVSLASRKEAASCQDAEAESINGSTIDKNCLESSLALATKSGGENIEPTKVSSSSHAETEQSDEIKRGSQSEQKTIDETKDESQYEKKTMTVMRGGELVQVSYKVYIPKKTSSLGRRQLRR
ncbi:hypothetical protein EUTSA_v10013275mg [Eutrema salsugineum]|uniref:Uncharacterized protein n=1 Tax=Eutrema salsugineum TaxID=72664 RepID=V4NB45_EUTSA|nr:hypothetical protein EUTSA_v10013275mg [Eutrema salsugineum]